MRSPRRYIPGCLLLAAVAAFGAIAADSRPANPAAAVQKALQYLEAGQDAQAEELAFSLTHGTDGPQGQSARSWAIVAEARLRQGQYASAARAYRLFLASCGCPFTRQYVQRQMDACQSALEPAEKPKPPSQLLSTAELDELAKVDATTFSESSEHFVVRARNAKLAGLLARQAEEALGRICRALLAGQMYPHAVEIHVWADRADFVAHAADAPEWAGGSFRIASRDGQTVRRIDLTQIDAAGRFAAIMIDRVLPHEMCHLVMAEFFGESPCPLFLDEGLAMLAEPVADNQRLALAAAALAGRKKIPLDDLLLKDRQDLSDRAAFYAEAFSFAQFLASRLTRQQFADFLRYLKDGCGVADALQRAIYASPSGDFLAALAETWEDYAIAQGQFLNALSRGVP